MAADLVEAMTGRAGDVDVHVELSDDFREAVDHARATTAEPSARPPSPPTGTGKRYVTWWSTAA